MAEVHVSSRAGGAPLVCPFCHDTLGIGPKVACPACAAGYHEECAITFGRCAALACQGRLTSGLAAVPLPRLGALARRFRAWWVQALPQGSGWAVFFLAPSRQVQLDARAARAVGEMLGHTAYDGRLRLQVPHPDLVCRVDSLAEAERLRARLGAVGVPAHVIPLEELVRPLAPFVATSLAVGEGLVLTDAEGGVRSLPRAGRRLLLTASLVESTMRSFTVHKPSNASSARYGGTRTTRVQRAERSVKRSAFLLGEHDDEQPLLLTEGAVATKGLPRRPTARQSFDEVLAAVTGPGTEVDELGGSLHANLLQPTGLLDGVMSNGAALGLIARLTHFAWRTGVRDAPAVKATPRGDPAAKTTPRGGPPPKRR